MSRNRTAVRWAGMTAMLAMAALSMPRQALGDGTEILGDPVGLELAMGSDILMAGVGLVDVQPGIIDIEIPAGNSVEQVLLYWEGHETTKTGQGETDTIMINGIEVTGDRIGGPTFFFVAPDGRANTSTYRADITALDLLVEGPNALTVEGLDFDRRNNGAGVLVVVDDGVSTTELQLKDGNDAAFAKFGTPLDTTVPVTYEFEAADVDRTAWLSLFVTSVSREDPSGAIGRPTVVEISIDDVLVEELVDQFVNSDGPEWDTLVHAITIPAGATKVTVQLLSKDLGTGPFAGNLVASMVWITSSFALLSPTPDDPGGDEGCTLGYWKNHIKSWEPTGLSPWDKIKDVFDLPECFSSLGNKKLIHALMFPGGPGAAGKARLLLKQAVAAVLNASHPDVAYGIVDAQTIIDEVNAVLATKDADQILELKDWLDELNNAGCPLNGGKNGCDRGDRDCDRDRDRNCGRDRDRRSCRRDRDNDRDNDRRGRGRNGRGGRCR